MTSKQNLERQLARDLNYALRIEKSERKIDRSDIYEKIAAAVALAGVGVGILTRKPEVIAIVGSAGGLGAAVAHMVKKNEKINCRKLKEDRARDPEA